MMDRLKSKFLNSIVYFSLSTTFGRVVNGLALLIILKKLSPEEIGLVSIAAVFVTILGAVSEIGFEAALVQSPGLSERQKTGVFWLGLGLAGLVYAAVFFAAPAAARFFNQPDLTHLIRVSMLALLFNALKIVPYSQMIRNLEFGKISLIESISMLVSSVLMVALALCGLGPWSLVLAELFRALCLLAGSQAGSFFVPGRRFFFREVTPLLRFGFYATSSRILYNVYTNSDYLIVGKFFGTAAVGIYTLAYRLVFDTLKAGTGIINKVAYPTFARLRTDIVRLRRYFFSIARANLSLLSLFLAVAACYSDWAMESLGYQEWLGAVPMVRLFAVIGLLRCVIPLMPQLLNALGHSKLNMYYSALCAVVMPPAFYAGAHVSIYGVVSAWLLVYPLAASLLLYFTIRHLALSPGKFAAEFAAPLKILLSGVSVLVLIRFALDKLAHGSPEPFWPAALLLSPGVWLIGGMIFDKRLAGELRSWLRRARP